MVPSIALGTTGNLNVLPDDIFNYNHEKFYEFIKQKYGDDLSQLLSFQAIRNGTHLLDTTLEDILLILEEESEDINKLKELCCFIASNNKYFVKLGVKLAIKNLIQSLKMKQEQQKKKKRSSKQDLSVHLNTTTINNETQSQDEISSPSLTLLDPLSNSAFSTPSLTLPDPPASGTLSTASRLLSTQQRLDELGHKIDIEKRISKWWKSINGDESSFREGTHYTVEINKLMDDTFACFLTCQCHVRFKLPLTTSGFFKLSAFCRHFREKHHVKLLKRKYNQENDLDDDTNISASQSEMFDHSSESSNTQPKEAMKTSMETISKRFRSSSIQSFQ